MRIEFEKWLRSLEGYFGPEMINFERTPGRKWRYTKADVQALWMAWNAGYDKGHEDAQP